MKEREIVAKLIDINTGEELYDFRQGDRIIPGKNEDE